MAWQIFPVALKTPIEKSLHTVMGQYLEHHWKFLAMAKLWNIGSLRKTSARMFYVPVGDIQAVTSTFTGWCHFHLNFDLRFVRGVIHITSAVKMRHRAWQTSNLDTALVTQRRRIREKAGVDIFCGYQTMCLLIVDPINPTSKTPLPLSKCTEKKQVATQLRHLQWQFRISIIGFCFAVLVHCKKFLHWQFRISIIGFWFAVLVHCKKFVIWNNLEDQRQPRSQKKHRHVQLMPDVKTMRLIRLFNLHESKILKRFLWSSFSIKMRAAALNVLYEPKLVLPPS